MYTDIRVNKLFCPYAKCSHFALVVRTLPHCQDTKDIIYAIQGTIRQGYATTTGNSVHSGHLRQNLCMMDWWST